MPRSPGDARRAVVLAALACRCRERRAARSRGGAASELDRDADAARTRDRPPRAVRAAGGGGCAAVTGRVLYVEAVDPDGDGDAHYVVAGGDVTARA